MDNQGFTVEKFEFPVSPTDLPLYDAMCRDFTVTAICEKKVDMDNQKWLEEIASGTRPSRAGRPELPEEQQAVALAYDAWSEVLPTDRQEVERTAWRKLRLEAMKALNGGTAMPPGELRRVLVDSVTDFTGVSATLVGHNVSVLFGGGVVEIRSHEVSVSFTPAHLEEPQRSVRLAVLDQIREWVSQGVL